MKTFRVILFGIIFSIGCTFSESDKANFNLLGEWTSNVQPTQGNIIIKKDSIYYPFYNSSFHYTVIDDSIKIYLLDKTYEARYNLIKDTLFFYSADGLDTAFRITAAMD